MNAHLMHVFTTTFFGDDYFFLALQYIHGYIIKQAKRRFCVVIILLCTIFNYFSRNYVFKYITIICNCNNTSKTKYLIHFYFENLEKIRKHKNLNIGDGHLNV